MQESRESEVNLKTQKAVSEKYNIESFNATDDNRMSYEAEIRMKIADIKRQIDKKTRGNQEQSTLSMLFEIEVQLEKYMRFFTICLKIDPQSINMLVKYIRARNKDLKQIENNKRKNEEEERNNLLRMLKQKKPRKVQGIKIPVYRSAK